MNFLYAFVALISGVAIYRLGRRDGEAGRVKPLHARHKRPSDDLAHRIERYNGTVEGR